jgi:predicted O-methyltransferase YrrM
MRKRKANSAEVNDAAAVARGMLWDALSESNQIDLPQIEGLPPAGKWSLAPDALRFLISLFKQLKPRHVLEFGSGLSTYILSWLCVDLQPACYITSIDNDPEFGAAATQKLKELGTDDHTKVQIAPLIVRDCAGRPLPLYHLRSTRFASRRPPDLVLIDGPPAVLGGREGTLYQIMDFARAGTIVLLDDADRPGEQAALGQWLAHLGAAIEVIHLPGFSKGLAAVIVREPIPLPDLAAHQLSLVTEDLAALLPQGESFIVVDDNQWDKNEITPGRRHYPFLERDGQYWGPPADDFIAIDELQRLRRLGAAFIVFGWPSFWWLDYYSQLHRHLRNNFRCVLENGRVVGFDLRT